MTTRPITEMVATRVLGLNDKRSVAAFSRMCGVLLLTCGLPVAFGVTRANAQPVVSVLVLEDPAVPHTQLIAALRIELSDHPELRVLVRDAPQGLEARMGVANELARDPAVAAVVWVDSESVRTSAPRDSTVLVYVVGRRAGRALLELVRVPANERPDGERVVALKLGELLRDLLERRGAAEMLALAAEPSVLSEAAPAPSHAETESEQANRLWRGTFELGPRLEAALDARLTRLGLGGSLRVLALSGSYGIGVALGLDVYPNVERPGSGANSGFSLSLSELAPLLRCDLALRIGSFALVARAGGALAFIAITGRDFGGRVQELSVVSLAGTLGAALERELWRGLAVGAFVDMRYSAQRHKFYIHDMRALDFGNTQLTFGLNVQLHLPLSAAP